VKTNYATDSFPDTHHQLIADQTTYIEDEVPQTNRISIGPSTPTKINYAKETPQVRISIF
jgi:hypothetical protein